MVVMKNFLRLIPLNASDKSFYLPHYHSFYSFRVEIKWNFKMIIPSAHVDLRQWNCCCFLRFIFENFLTRISSQELDTLNMHSHFYVFNTSLSFLNCVILIACDLQLVQLVPVVETLYSSQSVEWRIYATIGRDLDPHEWLLLQSLLVEF